MRLRGDDRSARPAYITLLQRNPGDDEARFLLTQIDARAGYAQAAEKSYQLLIERHPADPELRAGYAQLLMWGRRWKDAEEVLADALARHPDDCSLLLARARLAHYHGDAPSAIELADRAEAACPHDPDIGAFRDRLFSTEIRGLARIDLFPGGYPTLLMFGQSLTHRFRSWELTFANQVLERHGGGDVSVVDLRTLAGIQYVYGPAGSLGGALGFGVPATAIPKVDLRLTGSFAIAARASVGLALSVSKYSQDKTVASVTMALGVAPSDAWQVDLRASATNVALGAPPAGAASTASDTVFGAGGRITSRHIRRVDVGVDYAYGVQLDQTPSVYQLLTLKSHIGALFTDVLLSRHYGFRSLVSLEMRRPPAGDLICIPSAELGAYVRF